MMIKPLETEEEIKGKAFVHWQAWKEAYPGLIDQAFLDGRTLEIFVSIRGSAFALTEKSRSLLWERPSRKQGWF